MPALVIVWTFFIMWTMISLGISRYHERASAGERGLSVTPAASFSSRWDPCFIGFPLSVKYETAPRLPRACRIPGNSKLPLRGCSWAQGNRLRDRAVCSSSRNPSFTRPWKVCLASSAWKIYDSPSTIPWSKSASPVLATFRTMVSHALSFPFKVTSTTKPSH